jgi:hypothetical protein
VKQWYLPDHVTSLYFIVITLVTVSRHDRQTDRETDMGRGIGVYLPDAPGP